MEELLSGIVLGGVNYSENDKILSIFTLEKGVVSAKIKGVKKAGAKLKFAAEPFCFAEFSFAKTGKNRTVTGASLIESFYPVREDIFKFFSAGTVLEYVKKFLKDGIVSEELFYTVVDALKRIAYGDDCPEFVLVSFLVKALTLSGYALNFDGCLSCNEDILGRVFFDPSMGGFFCEECRTQSAIEINPLTLKALQKVTTSDTLQKEECVNPLKLLDYYLLEKTDESLSSLKELIKLCNNI